MDFKFLIVFNVKIVIKYEILHPASKFTLHYLKDRIILPINVGEEHYYFIVTIQFLPIIFGILFKIHLCLKWYKSDCELVGL